VRSSARSPEALAAFRAGARDPDEYVRRAALAGLGRCAARSPEAVADLFELLRGEDLRTAHSALEELDRLPEPPPELVPALAAILRAPQVAYLDQAAAPLLARLGYRPTDADLPALLRGIEAQNTSMAFAAATLLARLGPPAVPGLAARLGAEATQVRSCAARALAEIGPAAAVALPALAGLLNDPDVWVRQEALAAVVKVGAPAEAASLLRPCFRDRQGGVRAAAVRLCRELGPASLPLLPEMLDMLATEEEYTISTELHRALGGLAATAPEAVAALRGLLRAPGPVRLQACFALAQSGRGAAAAVPELMALLDSDEEMARRAAAEALGRMGPAAAVAVPRLLRWAQAKRASALHQTAIRALGQLGPVAAAAVPALNKCLRSADRWSRLYAAQALARMGAAAAPAVPLLETLTKSNDQPVRQAAEEALAAVRQALG
jgi:HEAT repeat protein